MNYLELINKCLVELNYKQVNAFSELIKNDHKKLKNIINIINSEICSLDKWNFLLRKEVLQLKKNSGELENTIDGRIKTIIIDGVKYEYFKDFEKFFTNSQPQNTYSLFNDKILLPIFNQTGRIDVYDYLKNSNADFDEDEISRISALVEKIENTAIQRYLEKQEHEKVLNNENESAKQRLRANAQNTSSDGLKNLVFTREQIGKMSGAEFAKHERAIMNQLKNGLIK